MSRYCTKCKRNLDETDFNWKIKNIRLAVHCKECSRKYIREHYKNNQLYYLQKAIKRNQYLKKKYHAYIGDYLSSHPCLDCGEKDVLVLEFDHRDKDVKRIEISRIISQGLSFDKLVLEISKCDVRCANCHRRKTAKENNSWKLKLAPVA